MTLTSDPGFDLKSGPLITGAVPWATFV